jgi:hypothetical protein
MALIVTATPGVHARIGGLAHPVASLGWPAEAPWREMAHFEYEYADCWRQAFILDVNRLSNTVLFKYF